MSGLVLAARSLRDALAGFDARTLSGEDAATVVDALARTEKICAAARARAAARAAECGAHRQQDFANANEWLSRKTGASSGTGERSDDLIAKLRGHPDPV